MLKQAHQPRGLLVEEVWRLGKQPSVAADEAIEGLGLGGLRLPQKTQQPAAGQGRRRDAQALGDQLGDFVNAACVLVVVPHERLAAPQDALLRIVQLVRDLDLLVHQNHVGGFLVQVVQLRADAEQEIVGAFELAALGLIDQLFLDQPGRGAHALLEKADPQKVLVVAQSAAAVFDVRLLHVNRPPKFLVAGGLVLHPRRDVGLHVPDHAPRDELVVELLEQRRVSRDAPCFEAGGFRLHVRVGKLDRTAHRAGAVPHFETRVPQGVEDLFHHGIQPRIELLRFVGMQEHDVHIAEKIHLSSAVATDRHECDARQLAGLREAFHRVLQQMPEHDVQEAGALRADLPPPFARPMLQRDAVILDLEEFLVEREQVLGVQRALGAELLLGVGEHFFAVSEHDVLQACEIAGDDARSRPAVDSMGGLAR